MDPVRFGRVLGIGTRLAGRTLVDAIDAAATPNPRSPTGEGEPTGKRPPTPTPTSRNAGEKEARTVRAGGQGVVLPPVRAGRSVPRPANIARGGRRFGEAMWGPFARASGVLWLEVTGVFFGLIALFGLQGMWTHRTAWRQTAEDHAAHQHLLLETAVAVAFGYFCISSFLRASRRGRRR